MASFTIQDNNWNDVVRVAYEANNNADEAIAAIIPLLSQSIWIDGAPADGGYDALADWVFNLYESAFQEGGVG